MNSSYSSNVVKGSGRSRKKRFRAPATILISLYSSLLKSTASASNYKIQIEYTI